MRINLSSHFDEGSPVMKRFNPKLSPTLLRQHKINLWNQFVDSNLIGITEEDCGILPRLLPYSYLSEIKRTAFDICLFAMKLLDLPTKELKSILPRGPIRDFLIDELDILKFRPLHRIGSLRFDMAIEGDAAKGNPPKLLEINDIGFGGISRATYLQNSLLNLLPQLKKQVYVIDAARAECRNYQSLGNSMARFQYDAYDWEEEVLIQEAAKKGITIKLISPSPLRFKWDHNDYPLLESQKLSFSKGKLVLSSTEYPEKKWKPDLIQMGFSFELKDFMRAPEMYHSLIRSSTPQYSPFITGLIASKAILVLLDDKNLRQRLLGSSKKLNSAILSAHMLESIRDEVHENYKNYVLKHVDGLGGERVYFDQDLLKQLQKIPKNKQHEWIAQERIKLNAIDLEGTLSLKRKLIADLGVFVQYQWNRGHFQHFSLGGFITRATNRSYKVNVSGGGIQVPVFFDKAA